MDIGHKRMRFRIVFFFSFEFAQKCCVMTRHVPGSQQPFSFIPDPGQKKEDASIISVSVYVVFTPLSQPIQFCPLPNQNFEKNAQYPAYPMEPWIQDPSGLLPIFMGLK